jgi:hypothetical protein
VAKLVVRYRRIGRVGREQKVPQRLSDVTTDPRRSYEALGVDDFARLGVVVGTA